MLRLLSYTFLSVITVNLLGTSGDIGMTWTSPIIPKLYSNGSDNPLGSPITKQIESWIGSSINVGAIVGPLPFGLISERIGRKMALLSVAVPHIIAYFTLAFAQNIYLFYFARFLSGMALGGGYALIPMYIAEIAEDSNRGTLSVMMNVFWTFGNFLPYVLGPYMTISWFNITLACIPTLFFVSFLMTAPETPYYLISKNRTAEAEDALMKLRAKTRSGVEKEVLRIKETLEENEDNRGQYLSLFKHHKKALGISLFLIVGQQLSGINAILFYTEMIFEASGTSDMQPEIESIIIGAILFASSFITPFVVDRLGRRLLLLVSAMGMAMSLSSLGAFFFLKNATSYDTDNIFWLPIVSLVLFIVTYNFGFSSVPWTVSSELFPGSVKSLAASVVAATCWTTSFVVTEFFEDLSDSLGEGKTFWLFAGTCLISMAFTYFFVPETKGKSFREIQDALHRGV